MKVLYSGLLLAIVFAASGCAPLGMSANVQLRSAPPPPRFEFSAEPRFTYLSDLRISVIADEGFGYDMFSSGGNFYLYNGGNWYSARNSRGPFMAIEVRRVPKPIFNVDDDQYRWRNHPEGWRAGQHKGDDKKDDRRGNDKQDEKRGGDGR